MRSQGLRNFLARAVLALVAPIACTSAPPPPPGMSIAFKCGELDMPCGNGCIPFADNNTCCATAGPSSTNSDYCVSGGCYANTSARCGTSAFCCTPLGQIGSKDCPTGQHHCGLGCQSLDRPCCDEAHGQRCNNETVAYTGSCTATPTDIACGYCETSGKCVACPQGACCHGDPCFGGGCVGGDACYVGGPAGSGGNGGSGGAGGSGGGTCSLPSQCSSDVDCSSFGARNCNPANGARCGSDALCHCCYSECGSGTGQCTCLGCDAACAGDKTCAGTTCVFSIGGQPCQ